jgi:hypothetical protein
MGLTEVLTNDHHFTQEGFTILLRFEYKISHAWGADILRECPGACRCLAAHP